MRSIIHILSPRNRHFHVYVCADSVVIYSCIDFQQVMQIHGVSIDGRVLAGNLIELTDVYFASSCSFPHGFFVLSHL